MIDKVVDSERKSAEELLTRSAQELALAFDQEVLSTIQTLEALAEGNNIKRGDVKAFYNVARRVLEKQKTWRNIILLDRNNRLMSARFAWGEDLGPVVDRKSLDEVFRTGLPSIGNIFRSQDNSFPGFAIRVPVRNFKNEIVYVLTAMFGLEPTQKLVLKFSTAPGEWTRALIDREGIIAGRSRDPEKHLGNPASASLRQAVKTTERGIVESTTLENVKAYTGIYQAPFSGYVAAVAVPQEILGTQADMAQKSGFIVGFLFLIFSALATFLFSRPITRSITEAATAAAALASGQTPGMGPSRIKELSELCQSLFSASELLQSQDRAKRDFVANMSHELRTPLGIVLGMTDLLSKDLIPADEVKRTWDVIKRNGQHLLRIINDILDFSKAEAQQVTIEPVEFSLPNLLSAIVEDFATTAQKNNVQLKLTKDAGAPTLVYTDPVRVRQMVSNLVDNALKFTENGFIEIYLHSMTDAKVKITVRDTGVGIDDVQAAKFFTAFTQGDASHTRKYGGTGLGLSLSRKIGIALGGNVKLVSSKLGAGSEFEITFEIGPAPEETTASQNVNPKIINEPQKGLKILLAEDSQENTTLIKFYLKTLEAKIDCAVNGNEAVELARAQQFDVILMDIQMPGLDGYGATAKIREAGIKTPIIALTAHALSEHKSRALSSGFTDYLTKPIDRGQLLAAVHRHGSPSI